MHQHLNPRHVVPAAGLPALGPAGDGGLPHDRAARVAARRAFVDLKLTFLEAINSLGSDDAGAGTLPPSWLRQQVERAEEPVDLWLLRAPVFSALAGLHPERRRQRQALRRALDTLFPDSELDGAPSAFTSF